MRYKRGKVISLTLLCVSLSMFLSGLLVMINFGSLFVRGATEDYFEIPGFDELYERIPFDPYDTGEVVLGTNNSVSATFSLKDEGFAQSSIYSLLNPTDTRPSDQVTEKLERVDSINVLRSKRTRNPYPLFDNLDMNTIVNGGEVEAPVILLDNADEDNAVIFELVNVGRPDQMTMKYNGEPMYENTFNSAAGGSDYVYGGKLVTNSNTDSNGNTVTYETFVPGAVAYNTIGSTTIRGIFKDVGYYEFSFDLNIAGADNMSKPVSLDFSFYIANKAEYDNNKLSFPRFPLSNRASGLGEVYNYSYDENYPSVEYDPDLFNVSIKSIESYVGEGEVNPGQFQFYNIGEYTMTSSLMYYYGGEAIPITGYEPYQSVLNILGFQAYYGGWHDDPEFRGPLPFFNSEDNESNSNISAYIDQTDGLSLPGVEILPDIPNTDPELAHSLNFSVELARLLDNLDEDTKLTPVKTNFPPVMFIGNVEYAIGYDASANEAILSTVAFHAPDNFNGPTKMWEHTTLEVGRPFSDAGEYIVTIYFRVNGELKRQIFYFEITNLIDIKFDTGREVDTESGKVPELLTLSELVRQKLYANQQVTVMYDGNPSLGEYEVPPTLKLERADLGSNDYKVVPSFDGTGSFQFTLTEGEYKFTVSYGAYGQSSSVAEVVVDHQDAGIIEAISDANRLSGIDAKLNAAVFGMGDVTLHWDNKLSGVNYKNVNVEYYKIDRTNYTVDPNGDRNYANYDQTEKNLFSAYDLDSSPTNNNNYTPIKTDTGWMLDETFCQVGAGIYNITIEDEIGNQTHFILIIDDSQSSFVQNVTSPSLNANITDFSDENPVRISFGKNKLVASSVELFVNEEEYNVLKNSAVIVTANRNGVPRTAISIPLARVEYNKDGAEYKSVTIEEFNQGFIQLGDESKDRGEGTYYFRAIDVLGNISEYYITLSHDNSLGLIFAEDKADALNDISRGLIFETKVDANTSMVLPTGGMSNRENISISFEQADIRSSFRVEKISVEFYPLNFDINSSKYPFASASVRTLAHQNNAGTIYTHEQEINGLLSSDPAGSYRVALYNSGSTTQHGLYKITRTYVGGGTLSDPKNKDYWFIVDDMGMLYYNVEGTSGYNADEVQYQTDLRVKFGDKTAVASSFDEKSNIINSNLAANVLGFESKYAGKTHFNVTKTDSSDVLDFPSLRPKFSVINNNQTIDLGEGSINEWVGQGEVKDNKFQLILSDGARSFPAVITSGNITEIKDEGTPTSANYGILNLFLDTKYGSQAEVIVKAAGDEEKVTSTPAMEFYNNRFTIVLDPMDMEKLDFRVKNDPKGFYADINLAMTGSTWESVGFNNQIPLIQNDGGVASQLPSTNIWYTYDLFNNYLYAEEINDGSKISVSVITEMGLITGYDILFDTNQPLYNFNRIKEQDNIARDLNDLDSGYVFGMSNDFKFERQTEGNPLLDVKEIKYRETFANGEGQEEYTEFSIDANIPFAELVGLRDNEMKYYQIEERDYAGHITTYRIQLKGDSYNNDITFMGSVSEAGDTMILGVEMQVRESSVPQFWADNSAFKIICNQDYYMVENGNASWSIDGVSGSGTKNQEHLIGILNNWINHYTQLGEKIDFIIYDRFGEPKELQFYNLRDFEPKVELNAYTEGGASVFLATTNYDELADFIKDPLFRNRFKLEIKDITDPSNVKIYDEELFNMPMTLLHDIAVFHDKKLIITLVDPFGRQTITEYQGQNKTGLEFTIYGNTIEQEGITYIGDSRGFELLFPRTTYYVNVFDESTGNQLENISSMTSGDMTTYYFYPDSEVPVSRYRIEAVGKLSGTVLYERRFVFDTRLPSVSWTNASDEDISLGSILVGTTNIKIDPTYYDSDFDVVLSYVREYGDNYGLVERVAMPVDLKKASQYQFNKVGRYTVILRNGIWASKEFEFEIADMSGAVVHVYDDGNEIKPSDKLYRFTNDDTGLVEYISNYIYTRDTLVDNLSNPYEGGLSITPSASANRKLIGQNGKSYHSIDLPNNTIIWCLGEEDVNENGETVYTSRIYFATTAVVVDSINDTNSSVGLLVDDEEIAPTLNSMVNTDAERIEVRLDHGTIIDTRDGIPYNQFRGNIFKIDCYYNNLLVRTMDYDDTFVITNSNPGVYDFVLRDLVGNEYFFGNVTDGINKFTIVNLTQPMAFINGESIINGMTYNDSVQLNISNLADEYLIKQYGEEEFNNYFYISKITVSRDTVEILNKEYESKHNQNSFSYTEKGSYKIDVEYAIGLHKEVKATYTFQIASSGVPMEDFKLPIYADVQIKSIKKNGYVVTDSYDLSAGSTLSFNAKDGTARYSIIMGTSNDITGERMHEIEFNIGYKTVVSNLMSLNVGTGAVAKGTVSIAFKPASIHFYQGDVKIQLLRNGYLHDEVLINEIFIQNYTFNQNLIWDATEIGNYTIMAFDEDGDVLYSDTWTIEAADNPMTTIVVVVIIIIVLIVLLIAFRLRRKMSIK